MPSGVPRGCCPATASRCEDRGARVKTFRLTFIDYCHRHSYIYSVEPRLMIRSRSGGSPGGAGECGARARFCNPLPGGFGYIRPTGTMTGLREASLHCGWPVRG